MNYTKTTNWSLQNNTYIYKYQDIESFRDRSELPEIEIQECQRKRKGNIQSYNEEERTMKMRITNRNY